MYANKRREHIHIIKQYINETKSYTGKRIILFYYINGNIKKDIYDLDNFYQHKYKNPKTKKHKKSQWIIIGEIYNNIVIKKMINYSKDKKFLMHHFLYESENKSFEYLLKTVNKFEDLNLNLKL